MRHLSDDEIMLLAEVTEDELVYTNNQLIMMNHLKTCKPCYEKFCCALTLMDVTSESGFEILSEIYGTKIEANLVKEAGRQLLAVISFVNDRVSGKKDKLMKQVRRVGDAFSFQPSIAMTSRSASSSNNTVCKIECINDSKTFIVFDPIRNELLIQINTKDSGYTDIKVFICPTSGEKLEIQMELTGYIYKGLVHNLPEGSFELKIESRK